MSDDRLSLYRGVSKNSRGITHHRLGKSQTYFTPSLPKLRQTDFSTADSKSAHGNGSTLSSTSVSVCHADDPNAVLLVTSPIAKSNCDSIDSTADCCIMDQVGWSGGTHVPDY